MNVEEYWTLEDLFYGVGDEELSVYDVTRWLRMRVLPVQPVKVETIRSIYKGWKEGKFFINGDKVGLREWSKN